MRKLTKSPKPTNNTHDEDWQSEAFRSQVMIDQSDKCAYCEFSKNGAARQLDHYRPKDNVRKKRGSRDCIGRGYWGLRNEWNNLLYSCTQCNSSKGTLFPLVDESERKIDATCMADVEGECPLILNPYEDEVGDHIFFDEFKACPRLSEDGTPSARGIETIAVFHLNNDNDKRKNLVDARKNRWNDYKNLKSYIESDKNLLTYLKTCPESQERNRIITSLEQRIMRKQQDFEHYKSPNAAFAGMFINQVIL